MPSELSNSAASKVAKLVIVARLAHIDHVLLYFFEVYKTRSALTAE